MVRVGFRDRRSGDKAPSTGGKLGLSLFFLFFFGMGTLFEALMLREFGRAAGQRAWKKVPCTVLDSDVREQGGEEPYMFAVRYQYEYGGQTCEGTVYKRGYRGSGEYSKTQELVRKFSAGLRTSCYVNPEDANEVVLQRDSPLIGLVCLFPLIFVAIGAGGIYSVWRKRPPEEARPIAAIAVDATRRKRLGKYGLAAFFGIFAVAGGAMLYFLSIRPISRTLAAESWVETPCRVLRAEVRSHSDDDGTTYSVHILYQYEFGGATYTNDRYDFMGGSSSGYKGKARVVDEYKSAERPVCYVNPQDPSESVLKRGFHAKLLLALFPLPFLLVGVGGIIGTLRGKGSSPVGMSAGGIEAPRPIGRMGPIGPMEFGAGGPQVLRPTHSPKVKFIGVAIIALVWNGVVSVFVVHAVGDLMHGGWSLIQLLFLLPFVAIGLGLAAAVVYQFLAMFNPRPTLELSSGVIPLGGSAELRWTFSGQVGRIGEFAVTLRGVEEARYRRGTNTYTDRNTFYEMELYRTSSPYEIASGQVGFVMPSDTMHSFEAENNKILWNLEVRGSIQRWPDVKESFKINVTPMVT